MSQLFLPSPFLLSRFPDKNSNIGETFFLFQCADPSGVLSKSLKILEKQTQHATETINVPKYLKIHTHFDTVTLISKIKRKHATAKTLLYTPICSSYQTVLYKFKLLNINQP